MQAHLSSDLKDYCITLPPTWTSGHTLALAPRAPRRGRRTTRVPVALALVSVLAQLSRDLAPASGQSASDVPRFERTVLDATVESNAHKPKVLARFTADGFNDLGSLDRKGFKL